MILRRPIGKFHGLITEDLSIGYHFQDYSDSRDDQSRSLRLLVQGGLPEVVWWGSIIVLRLGPGINSF